MPEFDMSVVKHAETLHDYKVTAKDETEARKLVLEVAREDVPWEHGDPEMVVDMCLELKEGEEDSA